MMIFCCPVPVFAPSASPALESVIIANQNNRESFHLWDDFLSTQKACHSCSCTYLQRFIGADLSEILSDITLSYLKKCEQWQWPLCAVVGYSTRKQKLRLHHSTQISGTRTVSLFSRYLHQPVLNCLLSCFLRSDALNCLLCKNISTADFTNLVILGLSKFC